MPASFQNKQKQTKKDFIHHDVYTGILLKIPYRVTTSCNLEYHNIFALVSSVCGNLTYFPFTKNDTSPAKLLELK